RRLSDNLEAAMTPDRWIQVKQAFEAVLQLPDAEREGHLERMRSSTPEIHREVISLLAAHAHAGSFLESGARISTPHDPSPPSRAREGPARPAGTRLGAYEVVALLGTGGMGKVYRGRDPRLQRDVALKVLRAERCGAGGRERFQKEARALAALGHPNVLAIHDSGSEGDHVFLVTELLEGQRLRDLLEGGALPARKARAYALAVAPPLPAPHPTPIPHRDP